MSTFIIILWPLWLAVLAFLVGVSAGWWLYKWALYRDWKEFGYLYLFGHQFWPHKHDPEGDELRREDEFRRKYGTMAEQGW